MTDANRRQILVAAKGSLRDVDKTNLRKAGALIVETDHPSDIRLMESESVPFDLPSGALSLGLAAALRASSAARDAFGLAIADALEVSA